MQIFITLIVSAVFGTYRASGEFPVVVGDEMFRRQVFDSLFLLQQKAPRVLNFIAHYVKRIETFEKSGMCVWCKPPTYQLAPLPSNMERYWLAGTIAHDSCHSWLYQINKRKLRGAEPPYESYSGFDPERICNAYQLQTLYKLQAPVETIEWMKKQDGTHCDLNHDGKCDDKDYQLRAYTSRIKPTLKIGSQNVAEEDIPQS